MTPTRILGIDPGSRRTGYGIIDSDGQNSVSVCQGVIRVEAHPFLYRLHRIRVAIQHLCNEYEPTQVSVESPFVGKNISSALKLGQARGAAIAGAMDNPSVKITEYAPREIKLVVTGTGDADKRLVKNYVCSILTIKESIPEDAADALAIALCHAHSTLINPVLQDGGRRSRRRGRGLRF